MNIQQACKILVKHSQSLGEILPKNHGGKVLRITLYMTVCMKLATNELTQTDFAYP